MDNYKKAIEQLAKNSTNIEFDNEGKEHAAIVLSSMIKNAKKDVKLYSGQLNSEVANNALFLNAFNKFIEAKFTIQVILEEIPNNTDGQSKALKRVVDLANNPVYNVSYKIADKSFRDNLSKLFHENKPYHFAVSDSKAYRIETDPKNYKAICNFNDTKITKKLENVFDAFFKRN